MELTREQIIDAASRVDDRGYHPRVRARARMLARLYAKGKDVSARQAKWNIPNELILKAGWELGLL